MGMSVIVVLCLSFSLFRWFLSLSLSLSSSPCSVSSFSFSFYLSLLLLSSKISSGVKVARLCSSSPLVVTVFCGVKELDFEEVCAGARFSVFVVCFFTVDFLRSLACELPLAWTASEATFDRIAQLTYGHKLRKWDTHPGRRWVRWGRTFVRGHGDSKASFRGKEKVREKATYKEYKGRRCTWNLEKNGMGGSSWQGKTVLSWCQAAASLGRKGKFTHFDHWPGTHYTSPSLPVWLCREWVCVLCVASVYSVHSVPKLCVCLYVLTVL